MKKRNALPRIFVMIACIGIIFAMTACEGPVGPKGDPGFDGTGWLSEFPTALRGTWTASGTGTWTINADTASRFVNSESTTYNFKLISCSPGVTTSELGTSYIVHQICTSISGSGASYSVGIYDSMGFHITNGKLKYGSLEYTKQ